MKDKEPQKILPNYPPPDRSKENNEDTVKRYLDRPKNETDEERARRIHRFRCGY